MHINYLLSILVFDLTCMALLYAVGTALHPFNARIETLSGMIFTLQPRGPKLDRSLGTNLDKYVRATADVF